MFSWQLTAIFELPISLISIYFIYVFLNGAGNQKLKLFLIALFLPVIILLPTALNVKEFYLTDGDCGGVLGALWFYIYAIEILSVVIIGYLSFRKYRELVRENKPLRLETVLFGIGSVAFLGLFNFSNISGELTKIYSINLIGPIGLLLFISILSYMIVKFNTFDIKLLGGQVLVWALVILIGSQFFYLQGHEVTAIILSAITLVVSSILGLALLRGIKKETALRRELQASNSGQKTLIHIMKHQIKGFLGTNKDIFAEILSGDYGNMPLSMKTLIEKGLEESSEGINYVMQILRGTSAEDGTLIYDMRKIDISEILKISFEEKKEQAEKKGVKISLEVETGDYKILGDKSYLGEAFKNLIDNSIDYTPNGSIQVKLGRRYDKVLIIVKDTGVGIREEDRPRLFKPGGIAKDSIRINIKSSGYGLIFIKGVVEAHGGKIWFESEGEGKGTTFFVEFPKARK